MARKQDRSLGLSQLEIPGILDKTDPLAQAMALTFDEPEDAYPATPAERPQEVPKPLPEAARTSGQIFGFPIAMQVEQRSQYSVEVTAWEWVGGCEGWLPWVNVFGLETGPTFNECMRKVRKLLIEGERPAAIEQSPELRTLHTYWREHGEHLLRRDAD